MTNRVIIVTSIFTLVAIAVLAWFLTSQFRANALQALESVQQAHLFNLLAAVNVDDQGRLFGEPRMGDPRFDQVQSGWYWQATIIGSNARGLTSPSMFGTDFRREPVSEVPFDAAFQRSFVVTDATGLRVRVLETEFEVGNPTIAIRLQTTANFSQFEAGIRALRRSIMGVLAVFAIGLLVLNALLIRIGLRPLARAREQLVRVQRGELSGLSDTYPAEIEPLAAEINSLVDNNKRVVERARTQVGNLAHALKTPIAVLRNESSSKSSVDAPLVTEQVEEMNLYVQNYLKRAQIAAQSGGAVFRSDAVVVTEKLVSVMRKLNPDREILLSFPTDGDVTFAGEQSDFEEILGNLLENATKWSRSKVRCTLGTGLGEHAGRVVLVIEDDGPGIPEADRDIALKRGKRLDEAVAGTGLGLSIVADIVDAYGGSLELNDSDLGGLRVTVELPTVSA